MKNEKRYCPPICRNRESMPSGLLCRKYNERMGWDKKGTWQVSQCKVRHKIAKKGIQVKSGKPKVEELVAVHLGYDAENRRYTDYIIVHKPTNKVLGQMIEEYPYRVFHPIKFKHGWDAESWIKDGCIGEIQEDTQNLAVGFENWIVKPIE